MNNNLLRNEEVHVTSGKRFLHLIIDTVAIYLLLFIFAIFLNLLTYFDIYGPVLWLDGLSDFGYRVLAAFFMVVYYFTMEFFTQRTLGKYITGTMVVNEDGEKPSLKAILGRSLCRLIGFEAFGFFGDRRGWHDTASKTYVVKTKKWKELVELKEAFEEIGTTQNNTVEGSLL